MRSCDKSRPFSAICVVLYPDVRRMIEIQAEEGASAGEALINMAFEFDAFWKRESGSPKTKIRIRRAVGWRNFKNECLTVGHKDLCANLSSSTPTGGMLFATGGTKRLACRWVRGICFRHPRHQSQQHFPLYLHQYTKRGGRAYVSLARGIDHVILFLHLSP